MAEEVHAALLSAQSELFSNGSALSRGEADKVDVVEFGFVLGAGWSAVYSRGHVNSGLDCGGQAYLVKVKKLGEKGN